MTIATHLDTELAGAEGEAFDAFLRGAPFAAYQQSRSWAAVVPRSAVQDYLLFRAIEHGALIGAAVVRRTRLAPNAWLATLQRGPIVHDAERFADVLAALDAALLAKGCCSAQLAPRVRGRAMPIMADAMRDAGYTPLAKQPLHVATGIVWLDKPEAEVLAGFKQRGRRQLKIAEKAGVTVRPALGEADVAAYQCVIDAFRAARPDYDMGGLPDAAGQAALIADQGGAMLLAELDGAVIGGHAFVRQADEAIWLSLATSDDHPAIPRSYPLLWQGMRLARQMGCIGYDLAGIPVEEAADAGEANRMQFKSAFAPTRRIMPPMQIAALSPLRHLIFFGARQAYRASPLRRTLSALRGARG